MTQAKIMPLKELAARLDEPRSCGKTVVQCGGVFDLLHIGHIRHLQAAKKMGDLLVVVVTPDHFVNKGPGRPVFAQELRAEAVAGLDCVDYVAMNEWPTSVEAIRLLKPSLYVKGVEYKEAERDITGKIVDEEEAIRSVGGRLAFTDDITFSSSNILNRHADVLSPEARAFLDGFRARHAVTDVLRYLEDARRLKVLVVGEAIIDEYQYCTAIGKSSKEPTLVVKSLSSEKFAGGILAVANHVSGFAGQVSMITMLGDLNPQEDFVRQNLAASVRPFFLRRKDAPTIVKRRLIESYFFTKMMEVYEINDVDLDDADNAALCGHLEKELPQHDVVIVVDYGHGFLSREAIEIICARSKFLAVNAQSNAGNLGYHTISMYPRADYISTTEGEIRLEARNRRGDLKQMVEIVARRLACKKLAVTRGSHGCLCYDASAGFVEVPAVATKVVDRIGAGDAFLSITALCAAQQAPMDIVGFVGNAAGAQAVATVGNKKPIERLALLKHIESLMK